MSGTTGFVQMTAHEAAELRELSKLFNGVWNDPDIGESVRRTSKKFNPAITIPDEHPVVAHQQKQIGTLTEQVTGLQNMLTEYQTKAQQRDAEADLRKKLGDVQTRFGLSDAGMQGVIKTMQERQIADVEAAAALYRDNLPKTPPVSASSRMFDNRADMYGTTRQDERWEKLHTDEEGFWQDVVNEVFNEMPA
jgi:hypothetical protein